MTAASPSAVLFSSRDLSQMAESGIPPEEAARQIEIFRNPPPPTRILRPCRVGDGIRVLPEEEKPRLLQLAEGAAAAGRASRFVPASGAATRMFQDLLASLNEAEEGRAVETFFENLPRFAFAEALATAMARAGLAIERLLAEGNRREVLSFLLTSAGLGYADLCQRMVDLALPSNGVSQ